MTSFGYDLTLVPPGTVVGATGTGAAFAVIDKDQFRGQSIVTAASGGTPSLTVNIQTSHDAGATDAWRTIASFTAQTAANTSAWQDFVGLDRYIRATWTVSGSTPSFTFGVVGEAL
jgi:hypothetical protein